MFANGQNLSGWNLYPFLGYLFANTSMADTLAAQSTWNIPCCSIFFMNPQNLLTRTSEEYNQKERGVSYFMNLCRLWPLRTILSGNSCHQEITAAVLGDGNGCVFQIIREYRETERMMRGLRRLNQESLPIASAEKQKECGGVPLWAQSRGCM
jgi:hypothetical protein